MLKLTFPSHFHACNIDSICSMNEKFCKKVHNSQILFVLLQHLLDVYAF